MKENYVYPVKIYESDGMFEVCVPDFDDAVTCGDTQEEAVRAAQEIIAVNIIDLENEGRDIPVASDISDIQSSEGETVICVHVWMPYFRNITKEVYVKKTLTIPQWLDILSKEKNINFSAVLVKGLKNELGIEERRKK